MNIPENIPENAYFKIETIADLFSVPKTRVYAWITYGKLKAIKIVGSIRISRESILEFVENGQGKTINKSKKVTKAGITRSLRGRIKSVINRTGKIKSDTTMNLLGCCLDDFLAHIEKQFKPGMTWENYGMYGWHVDHIVPCAKFDLSNPEHQRICFHYTNLQPLWAKENLSKGKKLTRRNIRKIINSYH